MTYKEKAWIALLAVVVSLSVAAGYVEYFPGDVAAIRLLQSITPASEGWAEWISSTAKFPRNLILLAITVGISLKIAGSRAALQAVICFCGMWILGKWLGPLVGRPRPGSDLVTVAEQLFGYSFPSVFALAYASTVGFLAILFAVLRLQEQYERLAYHMLHPVISGLATRLALGAHWPSDILLRI